MKYKIVKSVISIRKNFWTK